MIPRKQPGNQISNEFTNPLELLAYLNLTPEQVEFSPQAMTQFRFKVPGSYARKIQVGNPHDPLLRQVLPVHNETLSNPGYLHDPLAEIDSLTQPGLLQKYHGRALLLVTPSCAINCRYCFRRHYPYDDKGHLWKQIKKNIQQLHSDPSISEVILSGGDPLSLSDNKLSELFSQLESIHHLKRIRIHSRYPIVAPERITAKFLSILKKSRFKTILVLHINHAREIDTENEYALKQLNAHNVILLNQSVLLKGVNDSVDTLQDLSESLIENNIHPYYLHMLDKVQGSAHFEVSEPEAISLYQSLRARLPGYMLPRLVREIPGKNSKLPVFA